MQLFSHFSCWFLHFPSFCVSVLYVVCDCVRCCAELAKTRLSMVLFLCHVWENSFFLNNVTTSFLHIYLFAIWCPRCCLSSHFNTPLLYRGGSTDLFYKWLTMMLLFFGLLHFKVWPVFVLVKWHFQQGCGQRKCRQLMLFLWETPWPSVIVHLYVPGNYKQKERTAEGKSE